MADDDSLKFDSPAWFAVKDAQRAGNLYAAFHFTNSKELAPAGTMAVLFSKIFDASQITPQAGGPAAGRGGVPLQYPFPGLRGLQALIKSFDPDKPGCKFSANAPWYPDTDCVTSINDFLVDYNEGTPPGLSHAQLVEVFHVIFAQEDVRLLAPFATTTDTGQPTRAW